MKRIAVYFSGHFRNLEETWAQYEMIFKDTDTLQFDFFFTLWDVQNYDNTVQITKEDVYKICPNAKYVNILLTSEYTVPDDLKSYCKNMVPQLYCLKQSFINLPSDYDYYIRMRSDLYFFTKDFLKTLFTTHANLFLVDKVWYNKSNYPKNDIFNDLFWIGDYTTSLYISNIYNTISNYPNNICTEKLIGTYLSKLTPLTIYTFDCDFNIDRRTKGAEMWLEESRVMTERRKQIESSGK